MGDKAKQNDCNRNSRRTIFALTANGLKAIAKRRSHDCEKENCRP
jgi:hypothetical protein